jgi:hypothetical protein
MAMYNRDLFSNKDVSEDWKAGEDSWEGSCAVDDKKRDVVDLEAIREISYAGSPLVCMCYDYDFVSSIDEFGGELVDVTFDSSRLGKEEIADHGNIVRHCGGLRTLCCRPAGQHEDPRSRGVHRWMLLVRSGRESRGLVINAVPAMMRQMVLSVTGNFFFSFSLSLVRSNFLNNLHTSEPAKRKTTTSKCTLDTSRQRKIIVETN